MAFLKNIEASEEIGAVFRNITSDVYTATESKQLPELSLSLIGNFYLKGRPQPDPALAADEVFWSAIKDSRAAALFAEFATRFPGSARATEARARLEELSKTGQPHTASRPGEQDSPGTTSTVVGWLFGSSSTSSCLTSAAGRGHCSIGCCPRKPPSGLSCYSADSAKRVINKSSVEQASCGRGAAFYGFTGSSSGW